IQTYQRAALGQHGLEGTDPCLQLLLRQRASPRVVLVLLCVVVDLLHRSSRVANRPWACDPQADSRSQALCRRDVSLRYIATIFGSVPQAQVAHAREKAARALMSRRRTATRFATGHPGRCGPVATTRPIVPR